MILSLATFYCAILQNFSEHFINNKGQWPKCKRTEQEQREVGWVRRYVLVQGGEYEFHGSYISINVFALNAHMLYGTTENKANILLRPLGVVETQTH